MQWLNSDKARKGRPKIQPLNPNPPTFANNKIITLWGGGCKKITNCSNKGYMWILYFRPQFFIYLHLFWFIFFSFIFFVLQVFTWVGLWKSHPTLCIPQILMSHIRSPSALTGNHRLSCIGYRKSKSWRFVVKKKKKIGSNSFYENSNDTLLVMCELGYPFLHIFRKSVQKLKGKKKNW